MTARWILPWAAAAMTAAAQTSPRFASAQVCAQCHTNITAPAETAPIGQHTLWQGSMMAFSAQDPYWRAKVAYETKVNPKAAAVIEDTCMRCHAPMQQFDLRGTGTLGAMANINALGGEGVSCTVCHQVLPNNLGTRASFTAGFEIEEGKRINGPHLNPFANPMITVSGYTPQHGQQILDSALCGSCHTVITPVLNGNGDIVGEFVEQAPFLEWLASDFPKDGRSCQSCHVPVRKEALPIAHRPNGTPYPQTSPRTPFGEHYFAGANAAGLSLLSVLFPAQAAALDRARYRALESLDGALGMTARAELEDDEIELRVELRNLTGHKLPTAFPSRRLWLHVRVADKDGAVVFSSGGYHNETGVIDGPEEISPHYDEIRRPDQVQIYEAETLDIDGKPTTSLLRAAGLLKDNRLLPRGFDLNRALPAPLSPASIEPVGVLHDEDFLPGGDVVKYKAPIRANAGPYTILVEAVYQTAKPTHAAIDAAVLPYQTPAVLARKELRLP